MSGSGTVVAPGLILEAPGGGTNAKAGGEQPPVGVGPPVVLCIGTRGTGAFRAATGECNVPAVETAPDVASISTGDGDRLCFGGSHNQFFVPVRLFGVNERCPPGVLCCEEASPNAGGISSTPSDVVPPPRSDGPTPSDAPVPPSDGIPLTSDSPPSEEITKLFPPRDGPPPSEGVFSGGLLTFNRFRLEIALSMFDIVEATWSSKWAGGMCGPGPALETERLEPIVVVSGPHGPPPPSVGGGN